MALNATQIYVYLNKIGLAHQVHFRDGNELVFYHWNRARSDLIPSLTIRGERIENFNYPRSIIPLAYRAANTRIINDLDPEKHGYVRDMRSEK